MGTPSDGFQAQARPPARRRIRREIRGHELRIRPDTKRLLQQAARASGRTLSQETEHQLRRALIEMGAPTYAFLQTIGQAVDSLVNFRDQKARWLDDPYLYRQARNAITAALDLFQPEGTPRQSD